MNITKDGPRCFQLGEVMFISITPNGSRLEIIEACDYYFTESLTKSEARDLIDRLTKLVDHMSDDMP